MEVIELPFRLFLVFTGFTFTDLQDFAPLFSLVIGLMGAGIIWNSPPKKASLALIFLMCLLSLWPILPNIGLYFMAHQIQSIQGTWPQVMVDDPKNWYGHATPQFDVLFNLVGYLEAFSGAWMVVFFTLLYGARSRFTSVQWRLFVGLVIIMILIFLLDPGHLYAWWLD